VWGPRPLTRLNLPFQMKAERERERERERKRERERECCLAEQQSLAFRQQECGMSGVGVRKRGKNAKHVHVCPGLALHSAPSDVAARASGYKGSRAVQSELRSAPLPKLNSSFHPDKKEKTLTGAAEKLYETDGTRDQLDRLQNGFLELKL